MESRLPRCCTRFSPIHQKFVDLSGSRQPQQFVSASVSGLPPPVGGTKYSTSVMLRTCLHLYYENNIPKKNTSGYLDSFSFFWFCWSLFIFHHLRLKRRRALLTFFCIPFYICRCKRRKENRSTGTSARKHQGSVCKDPN